MLCMFKLLGNLTQNIEYFFLKSEIITKYFIKTIK